jgi:hypothetical protein
MQEDNLSLFFDSAIHLGAYSNKRNLRRHRELLQEAGFAPATVRWSSPNTLGEAGRVVLGNRLAAYFLLSYLKLVARKPQIAT